MYGEQLFFLNLEKILEIFPEKKWQCCVLCCWKCLCGQSFTNKNAMKTHLRCVLPNTMSCSLTMCANTSLLWVFSLSRKCDYIVIFSNPTIISYSKETQTQRLIYKKCSRKWMMDAVIMLAFFNGLPIMFYQLWERQNILHLHKRVCSKICVICFLRGKSSWDSSKLTSRRRKACNCQNKIQSQS